jgi:phosphoglycolate phosphatase-like HAD superfamily hydrolase
MARVQMRKPMAKKTVTRVTAKKTVARPMAMKTASKPTAKRIVAKPVVKPKANDLLKKDVARAKTAVNKTRIAYAKDYGINARQYKRLEDIAGDTVAEGDLESVKQNADAIRWLTGEALKLGVATNQRGAKIAATRIMNQVVREVLGASKSTSNKKRK